MDWYILQVHSGTEKKVEKELLVQLEKKGLKSNIGKIEIPSEEVVEMKKGKKVNTDRKFFPGYMLIKMIMDDEIWHTVSYVAYERSFCAINNFGDSAASCERAIA